MSDVAARPGAPSLVLADLLPGALVRDVLLVAGAAGLTGLLAQVSIPLSFTPVPVTGQTLAVLLSGTALGWRRGTAAMVLYALAGVAGVPWFAGHSSGYASASFGYVIGFIVSAALCGFLAERRADRRLLTSVPAMLAGEAALYAFGLTWLAVDLHTGVAQTISLGLTPFLIGDTIKAALASALLPAAWKLTRR